MEESLRVHRFERISFVNGPGRRCVLWLQGCSLACPGCFNPESHSKDAGITMTIDSVLERIVQCEAEVQGLTISGGEPLQQMRPLLQLLHRVRKQTDLSVVLFTGFNDNELQQMPLWNELASNIDVSIAGRFDDSHRIATRLLGSSNKNVTFFTDRYCQADLDLVPHAEVVLGGDGEIVLSGIDPLQWSDG